MLVPVNIYYLMWMEVATNQGAPGSGGGGPYPSTISLFGNTMLFLLVLTLLNGLLARRFRSVALDRAELLVIYVMATVATAVVSIDFLDVLVPMMAHPFRFATPENRWAETLWPHVPTWISVRDPIAIRGWYEGNSSMYLWSNLRPWLVPIGVWSGVIFAMLFVMLCINTIVRRQWMEHDRLQFPIVELPMHITQPGRPLFVSRLMWLGFGIGGGITLLNGLALFIPALPTIRVKMWDIAPLMTSKPWNAIGWTPVSFYPYGIGLSFLLPLDMLFSCWFFYGMWRVLRILGAVWGVYDTTPNFPFMNQQALGAYYLIGVFALWTGRHHLAKALKAALGMGQDPDEGEGPMGYRTAFVGLVLGTAAVVLFFDLIGLRWWVAALAVGLYFALALAIARMHAEFGPPAHDLHFMGPEMVLTGTFGPKAFTTGELAGLSWFWWFNRAYRSIPIAYQLDGLKIAQRSGTSQRYMGVAIAAASFAAVVSGFWFYLHFGYQRGASVKMAGHVPWFGWEAWGTHFTNWFSAPKKPDVPATLAIGWGMAFAYFLYVMKLRVYWWPWHPLGFAVSTSYSICTLWVPMFIAWAAKLITLRFGGLKAYRTALPFFLGLLLGDFVVGCLWPLVGWVFGVTTYSFMQ